MTNQRGWKDGVYNPGFPPDKAYMERKAKEWAAGGFEWPEIKGVQFKRTKNQHKPMRNVVTRVVMVGFDPFNHSGLPAHIEDRVVLDFWANEEQQFILDWVNDAPEGEIRFGGHLNLYGDEHSYIPFPVVDMSVIRGGFQWDEAQIQADAVRRQIAENMGLPEELMKPTLRIPSFTNEVSYNGVKLSQLEIPEELEKTRQLVIELTKEVAVSDHPNLLTLFVARGGNIRDLTEFFALLKVAGEKEQVLEESFERDLRDIDFMSVLLGPVEGEFFDGNVERELQKTGLYRPQGGIDVFKVAALAKRNTTVEGELVDKGVEVRVIPDDELPPESTVKIQNATLSGMTLPRRPNPLREHWEKHGDPYEGRIPHIAAFSELAKLTSQSGRNETMAVYIEPVLTPEEIVDREQAIQEASAGKLDYLLEGTQWDPKNRK